VSAKPCARLWQAEAVLDGVLSRADAASFERHSATCAECTAERAALVRLASLGERMPTLEVTPLRRRALHHELLRRANEASVDARPSRFARLRVALPLAVCVLTLFVVFSRLSGKFSGSSSGVAPAFELNAAAQSRWHVAEPGSSLRLALEGGTYTISVKKLLKTQRFSLALPDGELEVRGTRFSVECDSHRTLRVAVEEGRVALRLAGRPELSLGPGQAWPAEMARAPAMSAAPRSELAVPAVSAHSPELAPKSAAHPTERRAPGNSTKVVANAAPRSSSVATDAAGASASPSTAAREFAEAMSAFSQGDFGTAEQLFRAFEQHYPQNPHVEDVLFLRALGRSRRGDASGARVLAREYLRRYPAGFRVVEAVEMAREPARPGLGARPGLVTFP
jgi:hypothetical protein